MSFFAVSSWCGLPFTYRNVMRVAAIEAPAQWDGGEELWWKATWLRWLLHEKVPDVALENLSVPSISPEYLLRTGKTQTSTG